MKCIKCKKKIIDEAVYCPFCGKKQLITGEDNKAKKKRPKGMGTITKYSGNRNKPYVARLPEVNGEKPLLGTYSTHKEAASSLNKYLLEHPEESQRTVDVFNWTFEQVFESYKKTARYTKSSKSNRNALSSAFTAYSELHKEKFRKILISDFQDCIDENENGMWSKAKMKTLANLLIGHAITLTIISNDLHHLLHVAADGKSKPIVIFTEENIKTLFENDTIPYIDLLLCFIYSGARPTELLTIETKDVYLDENYMIGGIKTEAGKDRIFIIHPKIKKYIEKWYNPNNKYLFYRLDTHEVITRFHWRDYIFSDIIKRFNFDEGLLPKSTRHTFATLADKYKVSDTVLNKMIGHTDTEFRRRTYTHPEIAEKLKEIRKIK